MSDFTPVGNTNYVPPPGSGLETLSGILGIQQRKQALISGGLDIQSQQAGLVSQQQKAQEIQAGVPLMTDPVGSGITDEEGNPTKDAYKIIKRAMPMTGDEHYKDILSNATANLTYKNTWMNMNRDVRNDVSARMAAVAADETGGQKAGLPEYTDMLDNIEKDYAGTPAESQIKKITSVTRDALTKSGKAHGLDGMQHVAMAFSRGGLGNAGISGSSGVGTPQASTQDQGGQIQPGVTAPALAGGGFSPTGVPIKKTIPPGYMMAPNGSIVRADNSGLSTPGGGATAPPAPGQPRTAAQDAPPPNAPKAVQDAFQQATQGANAHVDTVRTADENYGNNKAISAAIRHLASDSATGPGTKTWNSAMAFLGTNAGNNAQELGAFLDRQAATVRGQMGLPGTNAGAEDAKMIAGNTSYTPKVIQDKNDYTEALTEGLHQYRNGLDRVAGFSGQASPKAVNQFKSAWTQNFDPNVYKGEMAYKRSKADGDAFVKSLAPEEAASLAAKRKALQALSSGQLPQ